MREFLKDFLDVPGMYFFLILFLISIAGCTTYHISDYFYFKEKNDVNHTWKYCPTCDFGKDFFILNSVVPK